MPSVASNLVQVHMCSRQVCQTQVPRGMGGESGYSSTLSDTLDNLGPHDQRQRLRSIPMRFREEQRAFLRGKLRSVLEVCLQQWGSDLFPISHNPLGSIF